MMSGHPFILLIAIPMVAGILGYLIGRLRNEFSFIGAVFALYYGIRLFIQSRGQVTVLELGRVADFPIALRLDPLSGFILLFITIFTTIVVLYSFRFMKNREGLRGYYFYLLMTLGISNGVVLAANLVVLLFFWGSLLVVLYGILLIGSGETWRSARKALVVVGLSDFVLLLGIIVLFTRLRWIDLAPRLPMGLTHPDAIVGYLLILVGVLAKAGAIPLHTWIPQAAETAPATVLAFIPASLDKLLGIYLLTRLSVYMFSIASNMALRNLLMTIGAVTVLAAVMMAMVQKRMMKLLSFHAVSQVGYMVLGIGTGIPVGIAGGLFHMLNHSIYKAGLFLTAGSVEHWTKNDELERLGGLARQMPLTFFSFMVCALAIAGVPPLNGFVSKWMVYQGVLGIAGEGNRLFPLFLVAAMLGSVLTLASFLKLAHAVFLGQRPVHLAKVREVSITMWLPTVLLALACIVFGIFAFQIPLPGLIYPGLGFGYMEIPGIWQPIPATLLLFVALGIGALIYLFGTAARPVSGRTFVGGEKIADDEESRVPGVAFYSPVKHLPVVGEVMDFGGRGAFDIYNWLTTIPKAIGAFFRGWIDRPLEVFVAAVGKVVVVVTAELSRFQGGKLPFYIAWVFIGTLAFYLIFFLR
ncbi:MAG: complex I subunit 5 family protein [candidate division WOR-3 bacterium]